MMQQELVIQTEGSARGPPGWTTMLKSSGLGPTGLGRFSCNKAMHNQNLKSEEL